MRKLALAVSIFAISVVSASAADMAPRYTKAPPPPPVAVYDWTGFYIGGDIGGRWSDSNWTTTCLQPGFAATCVPSAFPAQFAFNNPSNFNSTSLKGGLYGGYNWQFNQTWVAGLEGDFQWGDKNRTKAGIPGAENPTVAGSPGLDFSSVRQTWDASLRARLGFLVSPSVLLFGTGGVAFTHVESSAHCGSNFPVGWCAINGVFQNTTQTRSSDRAGWTVGAGVEAMIAPNWLLRGEYRYADYGKFGSTIFAGNNGFVVNGDAINFATSLRTQSATVGIAYKFGGPVVARY